MSAREIKQVTWKAEPLGDLPSDQVALLAWLERRATADNLAYALIHADDGVIWGKFEDGRWSWSSDAFPDVSPTLNAITLQQARLFGLKAEVFLWRDARTLKGRVIRDDLLGDQECFDEPQLLWGKPDGETRQGFQLMREGAQGLLHAPPAAIAAQGRLVTRNYIAYDDEGCAYVKASRLVIEQEK